MWALDRGEFVGACQAWGDTWEVLHWGFGFQTAHGIYLGRHAASVVAEAFAVLLTAQETTR